MLGLDLEVYCNSAFPVVSTTFILPTPHSCKIIRMMILRWHYWLSPRTHCMWAIHLGRNPCLSSTRTMAFKLSPNPGSTDHSEEWASVGKSNKLSRDVGSPTGGARRAVQAAVGAPGAATKCAHSTTGWCACFPEQGGGNSRLRAPAPMTPPKSPRPRDLATPPQEPKSPIARDPAPRAQDSTP